MEVESNTEHNVFLKDFIKWYKESSILWDKKHPKYKSRRERDVSLNGLVLKCKEYYPDASPDFVKAKIESMRSVFRREYKKVQVSKEKAKCNEEIYVPSLWYYNLLGFIVNEDIKEDPSVEQNIELSKMLWNKHQSVALIDLLKEYPVLYSFETSGNKRKRMDAYKKIAEALTKEFGRKFEAFEVKNKIHSLKYLFKREYRQRLTKKAKKGAALWCYDLLIFLKDSVDPKKTGPKVQNEEQDEETIDEEMWSHLENESDLERKMENVYEDKNQYDIYDTIGKNVAIKLRDMSDDQRTYAENLINEVMYNGLMEKLNAESRLDLMDDFD